MIEALEIDPFDSNHWLYGTGLTIMGGHNLLSWDTVYNVSISTLASGIEEMAVTALASVPGGSELLMAVGDDSGFTYVSSSNLLTAPANLWMTPEFTTSVSVDYAGLAVADIVRAGNTAGSQQIGVSSNGGVTWKYVHALTSIFVPDLLSNNLKLLTTRTWLTCVFNSIDYGSNNETTGGQVAYSASGDTVVWSTSSMGVLRSQYTATFAAVSGLPATAYIASDKQNDNYFYGGYSSTFYVSSNNGATFAAGGALTGAPTVNDVIAHPKTAGTVYVSTSAGIYLSTNFGASFTVLTTTLTNVYQIALGLGPSSSWYLYAFGTGADGNRLYGSADNGKTWTDIQGTMSFGAISSAKLAGSGNVAGQVYVGTNGRGAFYAQGTITGSTVTTSSTSSSKTTTSTTSTKSSSTSTNTSKTSTVSTSTKSSTVSTSSTKTSSSTTATGTCTPTAEYGQCGGIGFTGCTTCASGSTCTYSNAYYSQCLA
jgi:xyloglucan-specific exo-beta-1,4-glucanase